MPRGRSSRLSSLAAFAVLFAACGDEGTTGLDATTGSADASVFPDALTSAPDATGNADAAARDATGGNPDALPTGGDAGMTTGPRSIVFLHTNDEHSHELGFGPEVDDNPVMRQDGIEGGVLRRTVVIDRLKAAARTAGSPSALVSAGDQMMGSLFHLANPTRGLDYALATLLGYDAMTLGNHEFDLGVSSLAGALTNGGIDAVGNPGIMQVPILATNIRFSATKADDDVLAALYSVAGDPTHPLRRTFIKSHGSGANAVRVGYIGLLGIDASFVAPFKTPVRFSLATNATTCRNDTACPGSVCVPPSSDPKAIDGHCAINTNEADPMHFAALVADAASAVAELRAQNVDLVVALSHVGVDERELATLEAMGMPLSDATSSEEILLAKSVDQALAAANLRGIDVIIGGHSHTALTRPITIPSPRTGGATYIVQAGANGLYVGKLRLTQADGTAPWILDGTFSGLEAVDDTVDPAMASPFIAQVLTGAIQQVVAGLESQAVASAGDRLIFPGEQCDGAVLPNNGACAGLIPGASGGTLSCFANRQLNLTACVFPAATCGNGSVEAGEGCDGAAFDGATCNSIGYEPAGVLRCNTNCALDVSGCIPHFPSLLEVVVNFGTTGAPVRDMAGPFDLFFYQLGTTTFDVPKPKANQESNLMNLVTDAARNSANVLVPAFATDPVRVAFNTNGVIRDGIETGRTGALTVEDLFRVLPLGVSPVETTPAFTLVDFWLRADELVRGLELGVSQGLTNDSFWIGVSGAKIEYDLSRAAGDRIMKVTLTSSSAQPFDDQTLERTPLYDRANGGFPSATRLIHVATSFYVALFLENLGYCPRDNLGAPTAQCAPCSAAAPQCPLMGSVCNTAAGQCVGPAPAAVSVRTLIPSTSQEIKEFLALTTYVRRQRTLPNAYDQPVPRRVCCVGAMCPADNSRSCD